MYTPDRFKEDDLTWKKKSTFSKPKKKKRYFEDKNYLQFLKSKKEHCFICNEPYSKVDLHHIYGLLEAGGTSDIYVIPLCSHFSKNNCHLKTGHSNFFEKMDKLLETDSKVFLRDYCKRRYSEFKGALC